MGASRGTAGDQYLAVYHVQRRCSGPDDLLRRSGYFEQDQVLVLLLWRKVHEQRETSRIWY